MEIIKGLVVLGFWLWGAAALAQTVDLELLAQPERAIAQGVITADTPDQARLTIPSLWWEHRQFGRPVVVNWLAYPQQQRVDLVVSRDLWSLIDYLEKYSLVNRFANAAGEYGYNLRVFNDQQVLLATANCPTNQPCQVILLRDIDRALPVNRRNRPLF